MDGAISSDEHNLTDIPSVEVTGATQLEAVSDQTKFEMLCLLHRFRGELAHFRITKAGNCAELRRLIDHSYGTKDADMALTDGQFCGCVNWDSAMDNDRRKARLPLQLPHCVRGDSNCEKLLPIRCYPLGDAINIEITIVSACDGIRAPIHCAINAMQYLNYTGIRYHVRSIELWETDKFAIEIGDCLNPLLPNGMDFEHDIIHKWKDANTMKDYADWVQHDDSRHILVLAGPPYVPRYDSFSKTRGHGFPRLSMHTGVNSVWFDIQEAMHKIVIGTSHGEKKKSHHVCSVITQTVMMNSEDMDIMDGQAGFPNRVVTEPRNGNQRDRSLWTSPAIPIPSGDLDYLSWLEPISYCLNTESLKLEWPCPRTPCRMSQPPEIRPILPKLAIAFSKWLETHNKADGLKESDWDYLKSTLVIDRATGATRLPNVQLVMQWLGWTEQAFNLVALAKPCQNMTECGRLDYAWCPICAEIIAKFGDSWNPRMMTAVLIQVLREHAVAHRFQVTDTHWEWNRLPHKCGPICPMR